MLLLLRLKTLLRNLILVPSGPLLLAMLGILLLKRHPRFARTCLIIGIGSLWLLSTPVVSDALSGLAEHYPPIDWGQAAGAQAIVILGGGGERNYAPEYGGPDAEPLLLERLTYGAYVARKTGLPVLVTGFHGEASAMREALYRDFAIEPRWVDAQSYDTFENARNSVRLLEADGIHRVILVTRATHMWRSVHEFSAAGMDVVPAPVGLLAKRDAGITRYVPNPDALLRSYGATYELLAEPVRIFFAVSHLRRH